MATDRAPVPTGVDRDRMTTGWVPLNGLSAIALAVDADRDYVLDGEFVLQDDALVSVYQRSYAEHFDAHPADLEELLSLAKVLRNPHAEATTGVDLQVPAILAVLQARGLELRGAEVVDIGTFQGDRSHPISVRLSPLHIACAADPRTAPEEWWQAKKCLAVWDAEG